MFVFHQKLRMTRFLPCYIYFLAVAITSQVLQAYGLIGAPCRPGQCVNGGTCETTNGRCRCPQTHAGIFCQQANPCNSSPCQQNAHCEAAENAGGSLSFRCVCSMGWQGEQCELPHLLPDLNPCQSTPCQNNGSCTLAASGGGFVCSCLAGFTGATCELEVDECAALKPCQRSGMCHNTRGGYECVCPPLYTGQNCESVYRPCSPSPCLTGAKCITTGALTYLCVCPRGTGGVHCERSIGNCSAHDCINVATCVDGLANTYECRCLPGFAGRRCDEDVDECTGGLHSNVRSPCLNGATCVNTAPGYQCICMNGWTGRDCNVNIDDCSPNPCQNGGLCRDRVGYYQCECPRGKTGPLCHLDDSCSAGPCHATARCDTNPIDGSAICRCAVGYSGPDCSRDLDECAAGGGGTTLCGGGTCINTIGSFECRCPLGLAGNRCETNIDECASDPCHNNGTCLDLRSGFRCVCLHGYTSTVCETDLDECASSNPCMNGAVCRNSPGSFNCQCAPGFEGKTCSNDIDECASSPCTNGGTCLNLVNSFACRCLNGYVGVVCERNSNDCTASTCLNGGTCVDGLASYTCTCLPGFHGDNCQLPPDPCDGEQCLNGGECTVEVVSPARSGKAEGSLLFEARCRCLSGFEGRRCESLVDWCQSAPCYNGATCLQLRGSLAFSCRCLPGWTGEACSMVAAPCDVAASLANIPISTLCNSGQCITNGSIHYCQCEAGFIGSRCETRVSPCTSDPCRNGATCFDDDMSAVSSATGNQRSNAYRCVCAVGFEGENCETNTDDCRARPCKNGGTCHDAIDGFMCSCPPGTAGVQCQNNPNDCSASSCHNGGTCVDGIDTFSCICCAGYVGPRCEGDVNECLSNPCFPAGTAACTQLTNDYQCTCRTGWTGRHCEARATTGVVCITEQPCQNGGTCWPVGSSGAICLCQPHFTGSLCEAPLSRRLEANSCQGVHRCINGATCMPSEDNSAGYTCSCAPGTSGTFCEHDVLDSCAEAPVCGENSVRCVDTIGGFTCICQKPWSGQRCEIAAASDTAVAAQPTSFHVTTLTTLSQYCIENDCMLKAHNSICDAECNVAACGLDGSDCSSEHRTIPWANCSTVTSHSGVRCQLTFGDGKCDSECNSEPCLYDGFDCSPSQKACDPAIENYCKLNYGNGHCDHGCYNEECGWDGLDCVQKTLSPATLANGDLIVIVLVTPSEFLNRSGEFLLKLGRLLRTVVKLKHDDQSQPLVFPWVSKDHNGDGKTANSKPGLFGCRAVLIIDNTKCSSFDHQACFEKTEYAAEFVTAALLNGWNPGMTINSATGAVTSPPNERISIPVYIYAIAGAFGLIVVCVLVGAFIGLRRKRAHGGTWFPDGFVHKSAGVTNKRRCPDGEAVDDKHNLPELHADDDRDIEQKRRCLEKVTTASEAEHLDAHLWKPCHYDASLRSSALTPPRHDEGQHDPNCRGPYGITPLMLAVTSAPRKTLRNQRGQSSSSSSSSASEDFEVLSELLERGANPNDKDDCDETALHHTARYGHADEARILLDKGADPNVKDSTGRTPLHAAIAADAYRVFQTLLRDRRTNLNERSHDGSTPMILAARLAVDDMVEALIQNKADANSTDDHGKTALHWAAAVNNTAAATILLKCGVNCDAQDDQDQTPLHLAAKEGSYDVANVLLCYGASRGIPDCQDRQAEELARERRHSRVANLLQQFGGRGTDKDSKTGSSRRNSKNRTSKPKSRTIGGGVRGDGCYRPSAPLLDASAMQVQGLVYSEAMPYFRCPHPLYSASDDSVPCRGSVGIEEAVEATACIPAKRSITITSHPLADENSRSRCQSGVQISTCHHPSYTDDMLLQQSTPAHLAKHWGRTFQPSSSRQHAESTLPPRSFHQPQTLYQPRASGALPYSSDAVRQAYRGAVFHSGSLNMLVPVDANVCAFPHTPSPRSGHNMLDDGVVYHQDVFVERRSDFALADCQYSRNLATVLERSPAPLQQRFAKHGADHVATPSPDSGTGWSSDCSGSPVARFVAGTAPAINTSALVARQTRLSSNGDSSPHSVWSEGISPIQPSKHDMLFI